MNIGYARLSMDRQGESLDTQRDAQHFFSDIVSGSKRQRHGLMNALAYMCPGDTLVVTRLDRAMRCGSGPATESVYDRRGIFFM